MIAERVLKEIRARLQFLVDVGLDYLTLDRSAATLAGGEAQRIRLASQIGSGLVGVLYVLDEPSIGLHQRDNRRLIETLERLRDLGNTVIVVEHDEETIRVADHVVDIGPGAGEHGGEIVYSGDVDGLSKRRGVDHRPLPVGQARDRGARRSGASRRRRQLVVRGGARAQPEGRRRRLPARLLRRRDGRLRLGQVDARQRHPPPGRSRSDLPLADRARAAPTRSRASSWSTR